MPVRARAIKDGVADIGAARPAAAASAKRLIGLFHAEGAQGGGRKNIIGKMTARRCLSACLYPICRSTDMLLTDMHVARERTTRRRRARHGLGEVITAPAHLRELLCDAGLDMRIARTRALRGRQGKLSRHAPALEHA